jgi:predicted TIM-barrel fold metal-dependent hydrolase
MAASLTRRDFVAAGLGAAMVAGAQTPRSVIDTHVHFYDPSRPQGVPWPSKTDALLYRPVLPAEYASLVRPLGITGAVIVEASSWLEDNQWILDLMKDHPMFVGYVGHLEPGTEGFRVNLARFAKNRLFRGIRVGGADLVKGVSQQPFEDDLKRLADAGLMMDALGNATMVAPLTAIAEKIPHLRIAIDHMPVEPPGWKLETMRELASHPQVFCKASTVLKRVAGEVSEDPALYKRSLDELWDIFGADRVMYGSNWPVSLNLASYSSVFNVVNRYVASRGAADSDKYFSTNSKACYQWIERT